MRNTAAIFSGRDDVTAASLAVLKWGTTRYAVEAFLPQCPPLTAHDAARGILLRHMAEFAT
jgi:hypothetical protein